MTIMEELSMKNTLKAGDERKIEEEFFQYIVIRLGDEQYGIDIRYIDNIVRMQHITRLRSIALFLTASTSIPLPSSLTSMTTLLPS